MAVVVVDERILNEGRGGGNRFFRCCCVFSGSPVSCYMRTRVDICTSYMYNVKEKKKRMLATEKNKRDTHAPHLVRRSQPSSSSQSPGCSVENAFVYLASATPIPHCSVFRGSCPSCPSLPPRSGSYGLPPRLAPLSFGPPGHRNI